MIKRLPLLVTSLVVACSPQDLDGGGTAHPNFDLTTPKGAASLALETLKKSVDAANCSAFGFSTPAEAKDAQLVDLGLAEERVTAIGPPPGSPFGVTQVKNLKTYAYSGAQGILGEILVVERNGTWRPAQIGANREMEQLNTTLAAARSANGVPKAIVRVRSLSEVYIRLDKGGQPRLIGPGKTDAFMNRPLEDSLLELRTRIEALEPPAPPL